MLIFGSCLFYNEHGHLIKTLPSYIYSQKIVIEYAICCRGAMWNFAVKLQYRFGWNLGKSFLILYRVLYFKYTIKKRIGKPQVVEYR